MDVMNKGKLPNLKVEIDGNKFETLPMIGSVVIGFAKRNDCEQENIVSFVINEGQRKLLVEVEKENISPFELSKATELKIGMFAVITGQISDEGIIFSKDLEQMEIIEAEDVWFMKVDEIDSKIREVVLDKLK